MSDTETRAGEAEAAEAAERAVFDAWAVREGDLPTVDASWWAIHRSGPTHSKWASDAAVAAAYPIIAAAVRAEHGEQIAQAIEQIPLSPGEILRGVSQVRARAARLARDSSS